MPTCKISAVADIELLQKAYKDFSLEELVGSKNYIEILNLAQILVKNKIILPFCFVKNMAITNVIGDFINGEFKHFKGEPMLDLTKNSVYNELTDNQIINYYTLLTSMGCFSNDKITDKQGRPTAAELAQQAISVMAQILKEEKYKYFVFSQNLSTVAHTKPSQEFLKFVSQYENELNPLTGKMEKRFFNIETLLSLEKSCPAIISTVIHNFSDIKERRSTINNKGVPVTVPWEKAIESYYLQTQYNSPLKTEQDAKIAKLFIANSIPEEIFTKTKELFAYAADKEIQPHILHKPLKETTIADEIRVIQNDTVLMLQNGKELIEKLYKKQFTYEMLAKNDPRNAIIGKYASCCCNIGGEIYGNNIAEATITAKDVQNLVINDINGNIIGKATIYVNETKGYAVINEFDINVLYKEHEVKENDGGYYLNPTPKQMQERQRIFDAFMRGIHSFVEEYDKLHPNKPIEKVNVGIGHNRLKTQCRRYILASKNLSVPLSYKFLDAENEQRTLYDRFNPVIINSEDEKLLNDCIKG